MRRFEWEDEMRTVCMCVDRGEKEEGGEGREREKEGGRK